VQHVGRQVQHVLHPLADHEGPEPLVQLGDVGVGAEPPVAEPVAPGAAVARRERVVRAELAVGDDVQQRPQVRGRVDDGRPGEQQLVPRLLGDGAHGDALRRVAALDLVRLVDDDGDPALCLHGLAVPEHLVAHHDGVGDARGVLVLQDEQVQPDPLRGLAPPRDQHVLGRHHQRAAAEPLDAL